MNAPSRRTFIFAAVILGAGLFALGGVCCIAPLRAAERAVVKRLALALDPAESAFNGDGSQEKPWKRWKAKPSIEPEPPRFLAIGDDPDGWFSASPPAPVDFALMFARLHDAGHRVIGSGYLMAWDEPEPLALLAVRKQLDRFDDAVLGLPLARGAAAEPVPAAFLRLSVAASKAEGDPSSLPQVNRVAVPNAELGGDRTKAGFTLLENEADAKDGRHYLLARWKDRIIFALPLATEIAALNINPKEIRILCGTEIRLGPGGPVIPIDEFGRTPARADLPSFDIPATTIVSDEKPIPPAADPMILRDLRGDIPDTERAWSDQLAGVVHALRAAPRYLPATVLPRPEPFVELALIGLLAFFGTWATFLRGLVWRVIVSVLIVGFGAELIYLLAARVNTWLPPFAVLAPGLATLILSFIPGRTEAAAPVIVSEEPAAAEVPQAPSEDAPVEIPAAELQPQIQPEPPPAPPANKAAKKVPAQPPARKAATKNGRKPPPKKKDR